MSALTRVICIRHGETPWNALGRWQGRAPVPLNETGRTQSAALARYAAAHLLPIHALVSSPTRRAWQTAEIIAEACHLTPCADDRLCEVDLGEWQGLTREEAMAWDAERFAAFEADWYTVPPPSGETRNEMMARMRAALDDYAAQYAGQTIALVTHGGSLGMLIESLFGRIQRPTLTNTSLTIFERDVSDAPANATWRLARVAWAPHLDQPAIGETW